MKRLTVPAVLVLVITLGSYTIFAAHSSHHDGNDAVTGGATNGGVTGGAVTGGGAGGETNGGMMDDMSGCGCAMMHMAVAATSDGGVIVAAAGKLIKYDAALMKVMEVDVSNDIDPNTANQKKP